jgi:hypothetical protein
MLDRLPKTIRDATSVLLRKILAEKSINSARISLVGPDGRN